MEIIKMKAQLIFILILLYQHSTKAHVINLPIQQLGLRPIESPATPLLLRSQPPAEAQLDSPLIAQHESPSLSYRIHVLPLIIQRDEKTGQHMLLNNGQSLIMAPNNFFVEVLPFNNDLHLMANSPFIPLDPNIQPTNANVVHLAPVNAEHVFAANPNNETPVVVTQIGSPLENTNDATPVVLRPGLTAPPMYNNVAQFLLPNNYPSFRPDHGLPLVASPKTVASHDTSYSDKLILSPSSNNVLLKLVDNKPTVMRSEDGYVVPLVDEVVGAQNSGNFAYRTEQIHGYAEPLYYGNMARKVSNDKTLVDKVDRPEVMEPEVILKTTYETTQAGEHPTVTNKEVENHNCTTEARSNNDAVVIEAAEINVSGDHKTEKVEDVHTEETKAEDETK